MDLEKYSITPGRGFLPACDPVALTGVEDFDATVGITAFDLPKLMLSDQLRDIIGRLPEPDMGALIEELDEPRLAAVMRACSYLTHAYVWGAKTPATHLPQNIARPFAAIAQHLDRPPVLSYDSYALNNWARMDPDGPIEVGNIKLLQNFLGGLDEEWFVLIHIEIEAKAAPAIGQIPTLLDGVQSSNRKAICASLAIIEQALAAMRQTFARMSERCDPYIYYHRVRPYIHGWKNNPALADGLVYQGVDEQAYFYRGETGAQSTIIPVLDAVFGIHHAEDELRSYLMEMRDYMPLGHRAFLAEVEAHSSLREFVIEWGKGEMMRLYNACIEHIYEFRALHLEFASSYIHNQAQSGENPAHIGTGGTPFMRYLKKHRNESARNLIIG
ncbi:MAG: hypothetical protein JKY27_03725 [Magnetovibrio sp.]|nr:hypothetical protein [Magnetovibrio sp.]